MKGQLRIDECPFKRERRTEDVSNATQEVLNISQILGIRFAAQICLISTEVFVVTQRTTLISVAEIIAEEASGVITTPKLIGLSVSRVCSIVSTFIRRSETNQCGILR